MAEGGQMDSLLDCSICLETLTTPVCLPCGHTFCLQCVTDHTHTLRGYPINEDSLNCPTCRQTVPIPDEGIGKLPRNYLAEQMKEKNTSTKISCNECRDQSEGALMRCVECDSNLCEKCILVHSRKTHHIKKIVTLQTTGFHTKCEHTETCPMHTGEVLLFFCEPCKVPLCRDCVMREHQGHGLEDIRKVADRARQDLTAAMNDKQSDIQNYDAMIAELTKTRDTIKHNTDKEIKKTREHTQLLLDRIKHKSTAIEQHIKTTGDASIFTLQTHIGKLFKSRADLQNDFKKIDEALKSTDYTESVNNSQRITKNTPRRPSKLNKVILNKRLKYLEFSGRDPDCLNLDKAFKTCEREVSPYQVDCESNFRKHVTAHTLMVPPISRKPRFMTSFNAPYSMYYAVASTSGEQVVLLTHGCRLVFYKKNGTKQAKSLLYKYRSQFTMSEWFPSDIDVADDDSLLIVNCDSRDADGGVYLFNKERVKMGEIEMDRPSAAAYVTDGEVAVLGGSRGDMYLEIWEVTGKPGKKIKIEIDYAVCIAVNKATNDIIVTHRTGVTAYRYPDLSVQWTYRGERDGKLVGASGVCVDGWGRVMVADQKRRRVIALSPEGEYITHFNTDYFMKNCAPLRLAVRESDELVIFGSGGKIYILSIVYKANSD